MSTIQTLLTDHIDIWTAADTAKKSGRGRSSGNAGSVYGIKKLRELILELAVRGKLVPQEPNDEPASDLLKRIQAEKAKLIAEGKIKKAKPLSPIAEEEKPFELPDGWEWVRLGEVCSYIQRGKGPAYVNNSDFFVISQKCVRWAGLDLSQARFIDPESLNKYEAIRLLCEGDILWNSTGTGTIGRACLVPPLDKQKILVADSHVTVVRPIGFWSIFLWRWIQSPSVQSQIEGVASGTTNQIELNTSTVISHPFPLPPLAEQHRIVAKVDELMALCDQLETQHSNAAEAHEKLVSHLLGTLTQSQSAEDFSANWQRIAAHFDTLFTTEISIDALKQTLLQLAVMGKLVPQDPNDEPVITLMNRLRMDRAKWLARNEENESECRSMQKKLAALCEGNAPFILPNSWAAVHLIDCCRLLVDCHNKTAPYTTSGIPIIRTSNIRERKFRMQDLKYVSEDTYQFWSRRCPPEPGDIMFTREAPMGEAAIIPLGAKYCLGQRTMLIRPMHDFIFNEYLLITLTEPHLLERSSDAAIGSTVKHLRVGAVEELNVPLPPLAEQHRIVAKVDELMAICDQLKSRITEANQLQQKLADVVVERAIS